MTLFLLRHARALRPAIPKGDKATRRLLRAEAGDAKLEPVLTADGHAQARALVESLDGERIERLLCSPALRCRQTLAPLAARRGLSVEVDARLLEGASVDVLHALCRELAETPTVLCTHGDLIPSLLVRLGVPEAHVRCAKASLWRVLSIGDERHASYDPPPALEAGAPTRLAVLDLGSTSFHLLVADLYEDGRLERVRRKRQMLRLGAHLGSDQDLPDELVDRVCDAAAELRDHAWSAGAKSLHCVATAAFRDGARGRRLASQLGARLRAPIRILSGVEEAHAIFAAFRRRLELGPEPVLGLDLGGGSLELAIGDSSHVDWETTLPLGAVRLSRRFATSPIDADIDAVRAHVREHIAPLREAIQEFGPVQCVATGGTARALGRLLLARPKSKARELCGLAIPLPTLSALRADLESTSHDERLRISGMSEERVDLLPSGAAILEETLHTLELPALTLCDWGLREGVLLTVLREARRHRRELYALPRIPTPT